MVAPTFIPIGHCNSHRQFARYVLFPSGRPQGRHMDDHVTYIHSSIHACMHPSNPWMQCNAYGIRMQTHKNAHARNMHTHSRTGWQTDGQTGGKIDWHGGVQTKINSDRQMHRWMGGQMDGETYGWMDVWMYGWMDAQAHIIYIYVCVCVCVHAQADKQTNKRTYVRTYIHTYIFGGV